MIRSTGHHRHRWMGISHLTLCDCNPKINQFKCVFCSSVCGRGEINMIKNEEGFDSMLNVWMWNVVLWAKQKEWDQPSPDILIIMKAVKMALFYDIYEMQTNTCILLYWIQQHFAGALTTQTQEGNYFFFILWREAVTQTLLSLQMYAKIWSHIMLKKTTKAKLSGFLTKPLCSQRRILSDWNLSQYGKHEFKFKFYVQLWYLLYVSMYHKGVLRTSLLCKNVCNCRDAETAAVKKFKSGLFFIICLLSSLWHLTWPAFSLLSLSEPPYC